MDDLALFRPEDEVLVAVSGGMDSVVLCHLLKAHGQKFSIAHVNYGLRGEESDGDELFVRSLAIEMDCRIFIYDARSKLSTAEGGIQEQARNIRYAWFEVLMQQEGLRFVLTAQHENDQAETVLFQFIRGGMISSLRGMLPVNGKVIRPLLGFKRNDIAGYAQENKIVWREDSSNSRSDYQRNYIRHQVIPSLLQVNQDVEHSLAKRAGVFREIELLVDSTIRAELSQCFVRSGSSLSILKEDIKTSAWPHLLLHAWLSPYDFSSASIEEAYALLHAQKGKMLVAANHMLWTNSHDLTITQIQESKEIEYRIDKLPWTDSSGLNLSLNECRIQDVDYGQQPHVLFADMEQVSFPLTIRTWRTGDHFQPFGMMGHKKISDFLMQEKVPAEKKDQVLVLVSSDQVVAIPGMRLAEPFRLTSKTNHVLRIAFDSAS